MLRIYSYTFSISLAYENAAKALITADKNLNQGRNEQVIRDVFIGRGILPNQNRKNKRVGLPFSQLG